MRCRPFSLLSLCLTINLLAVPAPKAESQIAPNFQSREFRSALGGVLHARFDSFAELKTGTTLFQLPQMNCSLSPEGESASYLCSAPASSNSEAGKLYGSLTSAVAAALPGYPLCTKPSTVQDIEVTSFCHYPKMFVIDASVRSGRGTVSVEVFSREAGDRGEPVQFLHAYALAEVGRHADAVSALKPILGPGASQQTYDRERDAYDTALKWTQDCALQQSCMASDFLAIGNTAAALRWQRQRIESLLEAEKENVHQGEKLDPASAKSLALADAYDLNARIKAAMGKLEPALRDLDSAFDALPRNAKSATREATYSDHRALMLAESKKYAEAAKACRQSLSIENSNRDQGDLRGPLCLEIYVLASGQASAGASDSFPQPEPAHNGAKNEMIDAQIEAVAATDNYSPLPRPTESHTMPEGNDDSPAWVLENGTQERLSVLMSGPLDQRIDLKPEQSTSVALPPGKYKVAAVVDGSNTLLFYGEQAFQSGVKYTSHFVISSNSIR
jgi:tetratricopeptide (TPR) repeat protein